MPKKPNSTSKPGSQSAIEKLQNQADQLVDDLEITDNSDEKREEILTNISETIKETLRKLKQEGSNVLGDFIFNEKIALLERTKKAVEALLVQLLSSPSSSARSYEALSMVIKVNAELLRDLEETNPNKDQSNPNNNENGSTIIVAPSEAMLDSIIKKRHSNHNQTKVVSKEIDD